MDTQRDTASVAIDLPSGFGGSPKLVAETLKFRNLGIKPTTENFPQGFVNSQKVPIRIAVFSGAIGVERPSQHCGIGDLESEFHM